MKCSFSVCMGRSTISPDLYDFNWANWIGNVIGRSKREQGRKNFVIIKYCFQFPIFVFFRSFQRSSSRFSRCTFLSSLLFSVLSVFLTFSSALVATWTFVLEFADRPVVVYITPYQLFRTQVISNDVFYFLYFSEGFISGPFPSQSPRCSSPEVHFWNWYMSFFKGILHHYIL